MNYFILKVSLQKFLYSHGTTLHESRGRNVYLVLFLNIVFNLPFNLKRSLSSSSNELWKTFTNCIIECSNVLPHFAHGILSLKTGYIIYESEVACLLGRSLCS